MTTRAEIEAEIARLQSRLQRTETDPKFTPSELVRWDPSLVGYLLRIQHHKYIPANAFDQLYNDEYEPGKTQLNIQEHIKSKEWFGRSYKDFDHNLSPMCSAEAEPRMAGQGVLTAFGCLTHVGFEGPKTHHKPYTMIWELRNQFEDVTIFKRVFHTMGTFVLPFMRNGEAPNHASLPCSDYNLKIVKMLAPSADYSKEELHVPLADPDMSLLDQIYVATSTKIPGIDKEVIIDHYTLSTLYKEWKADKDAGRTLRKTPLVEAHETIATLRKELQALKTDRDASVDKRDKLANALHIASNMICTTDPL